MGKEKLGLFYDVRKQSKQARKINPTKTSRDQSHVVNLVFFLFCWKKNPKNPRLKIKQYLDICSFYFSFFCLFFAGAIGQTGKTVFIFQRVAS